MYIFEKVKEVIMKYMYVDSSDITLKSSLKEDLGADEIAVIDIMMDLEDLFGIDIPDKKIGLRLDSIVDYIASQVPHIPEEVKIPA